MVMIAGIYQGDTRIGFRILDADVGTTMDAPDAAIISAINNGHTVMNLEVLDGKLKGSNGDISRFAKISNNKLMGTAKAPVVIINQLGSFGYTVADHNGKILKAKASDVIGYASSFGIANGKITSKGGAKFISAISGTYDVIPDPVTPTANKRESKLDNIEKPKETNITKTKVDEKQIVPSVTIDKTINEQVKKAETRQEKKLSRLSLLDTDQQYALKEYITWSNMDKDEAEEEIEYIIDGVEQNKHLYENSDTPLLIEILASFDNSIAMQGVFSEDLTRMIVLFLQTKLTFPKYLCTKISEELCKDIPNSCSIIFRQFKYRYMKDMVRRKYEAGVNYTFYVAADAYVNAMFTIYLMGNFSSETLSEDIKEDIKKYALCSEYTFVELRALVGVISAITSVECDMISKLSEKRIHNIHKLDKAADKYTRATKEFREILIEVTSSNVALNKYWEDIDQFDEVRTGPNIPVCGKICQVEVKLHDLDIKKLYAKYLNEQNGENNINFKVGIFVDEAYRMISNILFSERREKERLEREALEAERIKAEEDARKNIPNSGEYEEKTSELPSRQTCDTDGKNEMQKAIDSGADLSKFDRNELFRELDSRGLGKNGDICFTIARDIDKRKVPYNKLTSKQKYRFDEAINKMIQEFNGQRKASNTNIAQSSTSDIKAEAKVENATYMLSENQDIMDKVNRLLAKADSVEMATVLKTEPNVLKICYTILRYKKASDKQMIHINRAIEILDTQ